VLSFFLAFTLVLVGPSASIQRSPAAEIILLGDSAPATGLRKNLMDRLMDKFHAMNDAKQGFFQDDISPIVASYFPPGQPFAETQKVIHDQNLGELKKFKGMQEPGITQYVSKFSLMNGMFSEVYIVLNFEFVGQTEADMTVKKAIAYIRGGNM
jgi:hypothetical protein